MQYLLDIAREDLEVRAVSDRVTEFPNVQGIVLDLDPFWVFSWAVAQHRGIQGLQTLLNSYIARYPSLPDIARSLLPAYLVYLRPINASDLREWRPPFWIEYLHFLGVHTRDNSPVIIKVCLRPAMFNESIPSREALQELSPSYRVVLEGRRQAALSSNPRRKISPIVGGVSIGKSASLEFGTLSVILDDGTGRRYAITCAHVADQQNGDVIQPSLRDSKKATIFGKRIAGTTLTASAASTLCNPWTTVTTNEEDIALIEIDAKNISTLLEVMDVGTLNGVVPQSAVSTGQSVDVMGRTTKHSTLSVGGVAAWYRLSHQKKFYCFKNLFEVGSAYGVAGTIKGGDSGAPVCTPYGAGTGWSGMIVGDDGLKGFAMYSKTIEDWWKSQNYSLSVL